MILIRRIKQVDRTGVLKMAEKISDEEKSDALINVDSALDTLIAAITALDENLPAVKTDTNEQKIAIDRVKDLLETALVPYTADIVREIDGAFGE